MKPRKPTAFLPRERAERFSARSRVGMVEWEITIVPGTPKPFTQLLEHNVQLTIRRPHEKPCVTVLEPDAAYELREKLGLAIDQVVGA